MPPKRLLALAITASLSHLAHSAENAQNLQMETVTVIGSAETAKTLPGSSFIVGSEQLHTEATTDINQVLKTVPGVYIREEDGHGLRPNIGIRAATAERSQKITLLEDGILIAPAPYSGPAAYYFPTVMRMNSIEVLKGAPLLRYGPQTTGGVINLISTPIPEQSAGTAIFSANDRGSMDLLLNYGSTVDTDSGRWGFMLETVQRDHNGFKDIDRSNQSTGFEISDYVGKLSWQNDRNLVLFKLQHSKENSDETYLGLTDVDFKKDPNRRYGLSEIDNMDNEHDGINLSHTFNWTDNLNSTVSLYQNKFQRNWFKLSGGGNYVDDANDGISSAQNILDGGNVSGLKYQHNDREYVSQGIQANFNWFVGAHNLNAGVRVHEDETDRYQPFDTYNQSNGKLVFVSSTAPNPSNNRVESADAISLWLTDSYQATDNLLLNLSLRYEDIDTEEKRYTSKSRSNGTLQASNSTAELLPGISATYNLSDSWQLLAGYHKGMSPLGGGATENEDPETSNNFETGIRFNQEQLFAEAIIFYSDFNNKIEYCSIASPCSNGSNSGSYSVGGANISGLELQFGTLNTLGSFNIPVNASYTYTQAEISKTNITEGIVKGEQLKDVPENIFSVRAGLEHSSGWNNYLVAKYLDEMCVDIGCNNNNDKYERTQSLLTVDLISRYTLSIGPELFLKVENIFDEQRIVARDPDGARPNMPLTATAGVRYDF